MDIQKVLVIGSGLMGSGIAQVCAQAGIQVGLHDVSKDALDKALKSIDWSVGKFVEKGKFSHRPVNRLEGFVQGVLGQSPQVD